MGWTKPKKAASTKAVDWLKNLDFKKNVYPEKLMNEKAPPSIVFVP